MRKMWGTKNVICSIKIMKLKFETFTQLIIKILKIAHFNSNITFYHVKIAIC